MAGLEPGRKTEPFPSACFYGSTTIMKNSITVASKKRGRPPTGGRDPGVHVRLPETMLAAIDAKSTEEGTSRSEAIRRLVELGLKAKGK
jgi:hypothetical protein